MRTLKQPGGSDLSFTKLENFVQNVPSISHPRKINERAGFQGSLLRNRIQATIHELLSLFPFAVSSPLFLL